MGHKNMLNFFISRKDDSVILVFFKSYYCLNSTYFLVNLIKLLLIFFNVQLWCEKKFRMKLIESLGKPNKFLQFLSISASILQMARD